MADNPSDTRTLLRTPLYELHVQAGAKMVDFAGWSMPIQYQSILAEHQAVRAAVGVFDLSHMGRVVLRGPQATDLVQWLTVNDVRSLAEGQARYSLFCDEQGFILDDVVVYRRGATYLIVVNASNRLKIVDWIQQHREQRGFDAELADETFRLAMIGVQGPAAQQTLQPLVEADLDAIGYYRSTSTTVDGTEAMVARTGYTGEDGFEVILPGEPARALWQRLLEEGQSPRAVACGLGARDTLRLEAGMPLYGHEVAESIHPYEAGLGRVVKLEKGDFVGRAALARLRERPRERQLVGFRMIDNAVPRQGYPIQRAGRDVGWVTSGGFAPSLRLNVGMAYVPAELASPESEFDVVIRGRPMRARVVPLPFRPHQTRRKARG